MRTTIIILSILAIGLGIYFFSGKSEEQKRKEAIERLCKILHRDDPSITVSLVASTFKYGTSTDMNNLSDLFEKGLSNWSLSDGAAALLLERRLTGKA